MLLGIKARKCVTLITIFSFYPSSETYLTLGCRDSSLMSLLSIIYYLLSIMSLLSLLSSSLSKGIPWYSLGQTGGGGWGKGGQGFSPAGENIKDASIFSFHPGASSPGHAQNTLPKRSPEGILVICPHHL